MAATKQVWNTTPEGRERMREIAIARWKNPAYRRKMRAARERQQSAKSKESASSTAEAIIAREATKRAAPRRKMADQGGVTIMWNGLSIMFTASEIRVSK